MKKIPWSFNLTYLDPKSMRYNSVGDWYDPDDGGMMDIEVADMNNPDYNFLVLLHELVESYLCIRRGIYDKEVTKFDVSHPELPEPGKDKRAPYHKEHMVADKVERLLAKELKVNWKKYEEAQEKAMEDYE